MNTKPNAVVVGLVALLVIMAIPATAVTATVYTESWESGDLSGYTVTEEPGTDTFIDTANATDGSNSLRQTVENDDLSTDAITNETYSVDLNESFTLEFDNKYSWKSNNAVSQTRVILTDGTETLVILQSRGGSAPDGWSIFGTLVDSQTGTTSGDTQDSYGWTNVSVESQANNNTITLSANGTQQYSTNITGNFNDPDAVKVRYQTDVLAEGIENTQYSRSNFDNVSLTVGGIEPQPKESEDITLDVRNYMEPNGTYPYSVLYYNNTTDTTTDVTADANLTIENVTFNGSQVLTSPEKGTLRTITNSSVAAEVNVTAEYTVGAEILTQTKTIVVAAPTVENLAILPDAFIRAQAVFGDSAIYALLVAGILAVPATRFANAFAGIATAEMVIIIGWFGGYIGLGVTLLSVFAAIFIGLNLAQNIDYTVRR